MVDHHHPLLASVKVSECDYAHGAKTDSSNSFSCGLLDETFSFRFSLLSDLDGLTNIL